MFITQRKRIEQQANKYMQASRAYLAQHGANMNMVEIAERSELDAWERMHPQQFNTPTAEKLRAVLVAHAKEYTRQGLRPRSVGSYPYTVKGCALHG